MRVFYEVLNGVGTFFCLADTQLPFPLQLLSVIIASDDPGI